MPALLPVFVVSFAAFLLGRAIGRQTYVRVETNTMPRDEAYAILDLQPGATDTQIIAAHKSLILKFHPDQGGNNYLAAKINQAKDLLLAGK